jgi:prevent-host-death family protein
MKTLPLAEVRNRLSSLVDEVARTHDTLTITRKGVPTVVVLSVEDYESVMETFALLNDPQDQARLAEAEASIAAGDVTSAEEMAKLMAARRQREAHTL